LGGFGIEVSAQYVTVIEHGNEREDAVNDRAKRTERKMEDEEASESSKADWEERPRPTVDFDFWIRAPYWTVNEVAALLLGLEPSKDGTSWTVTECLRYIRIRDLLGRAQALNQLPETGPPMDFIEWVEAADFVIPNGLKAAIEARPSKRPDWKTLYRDLKIDYDKVKDNDQQLIEDLREHIAKLEADLQAANEALRVNRERGFARERETLLKLVIGMAVVGYRYDPIQFPNKVHSEIANDLKSAGVALDDDTVRKWLKKAAELLPPQTE
jgi:hypothetical protein